MSGEIIRSCRLLFLPLFAVLVLLMARRGGHFEYDPDEGQDLMKAQLVLHGHRLYREVWDDHPPALTYLLAGVFKITGSPVWAARGLMLGCSLLLLFSVGGMARALHGEFAGLVATVLLAATHRYAAMSFTVLNGVAAVAFAAFSLYLLLRWRTRSSVVIGRPRAAGAAAAAADVSLLAASAVAFALAMLTKLIVLPMLAMFAVAFLLPTGGPRAGRRSAAGWALAWGFLVLGLFALGCALGGVDFHQVVGSHLRGEAEVSDQHVLAAWLHHDWDLVALAALAVALAVARRDVRLLVPAAGLAVAVVAVCKHKPLWYHHMLLVSVPMAWMAGVAVAEVVRTAPRALAVALLAALVVYWPVKVWSGSHGLRVQAAPGDAEVVAALRSADTEWVFADRLIYAVYAHKLVPPPVAMLSVNRLRTEHDTDRLVADAIRRYRPSRVEVGRFAFGPAVKDVLRRGYRVMLKTDRGTVWAATHDGPVN